MRKKLSKCCNANLLPSGQCVNCGANGLEIITEEDLWEAEQAERTELQSLEDSFEDVLVDD